MATAAEHRAEIERINSEVATQAQKIAELSAILDGKASGGGEPVIEPLTVTENGTYTAPDGVDGYSPVTVNVGSNGNAEHTAALVGFLKRDLTEYIDTTGVTKLGQYAFYYWRGLTSVSFPELTNIAAYAFRTCVNLVNVDIPRVTTLGSACFYGCSSIVTIDLPSVTSIADNVFATASKLATLILRNNSVALLSNINAFSGTKIASGEGYMYVPSSLVDSYKIATNWNAYADQIRAIEDYPDITGV